MISLYFLAKLNESKTSLKSQSKVQTELANNFNYCDDNQQKIKRTRYLETHQSQALGKDL